MSKQDSQSMQSLPVDDVENGITSTPSDGKSVDSGASESATNTPSDPVSADQNSEAGASDKAAQAQAPSSPAGVKSTATNQSSVTSGASSSASPTAGASGAAAGTGAATGIPTAAIAAIIAVVAVVAAIAIGIVVTQQQNPGEDGNWYDGGAKQGQFEGKSKEEIQDALNEEVAKGMMNISIAAVVNFPAGSNEGEARIENIAANPMDQKVTIALKDSGDVVYESGAIAPDQHIQTITLNKALAPGDHAAVATFTGYDRETHKETGKAAAEIVLHVEG